MSVTERKAALADAGPEAPKPLKWKCPESGMWRAVRDGIEVSIYRECGEYHWQINTTDDGAARSFEEAVVVVTRLLGV